MPKSIELQVPTDAERYVARMIVVSYKRVDGVVYEHSNLKNAWVESSIPWDEVKSGTKGIRHG